MKKLCFIMLLFAACSTPEDREAVVNLTDPDKILWRSHSNKNHLREHFITLKDSCIYITYIHEDGELNFHKQIHCFKSN